MHLPHYNWVKWNGFQALTFSFISSQTQLYTTSQWRNYISLLEYQLVCWVFRRVDIERIYSLITQNLKFDWSIQITWKRKAPGKSDSLEQALIFVKLMSFLTLWDRWIILRKQKTQKHLCQSPFLISLKRTVFLKTRLWHRDFLVNFVKSLKHHFYRTLSDGCFYINGKYLPHQKYLTLIRPLIN